MMNEKTASKEDVTTAIVNIAKSASISDLRQFYIDRKCEDAEYQDNKELLELLARLGAGKPLPRGSASCNGANQECCA